MRNSAARLGLFWCIAPLCVAAIPAAPSAQFTPAQEAAWREILRLDSGPQAGTEAPNRFMERFCGHLKAQEGALRQFLALTPSEHTFEAKFRLVRVLALRAELENDPTRQEQADALLESLERGATPQQMAHIAFERISQWMRRNRLPSKEQRTELLAAAREFRDRFPSDPRVARLLVEVATQFDRDPELKRVLLEDAQKHTRDAALRRRIEDDFRKLGLLGKPLQLKFSDVNGRSVSLEQMRGKPVILLYVSGGAQSSLLGWKAINEVLQVWPDVQRVCVCVDDNRSAMERARQEHGEGWIVGWDGMGWNSPLARRWGINAVPTCWLLDSSGRLVSLNATDDLAGQLKALREARQSP